MKLGVFDSGLGGLLIAKAIRSKFPDIEMMYLGDTLHLPYGNRSAESIYEYCEQGIDFLFKSNCRLIIMACNTGSASALRRIQQSYLLQNYPERRVLGVVVPTIEYALDKGCQNLGLIGTSYTVSTNVYEEELCKINPNIHITQVKTPLLVPLIENRGEQWLDSVLESYFEPFLQTGIEALLLGCTHYVSLKERIKKRYNFDVIAQDEIIPHKLAQYFDNHPEIYGDIGRNGCDEFWLSDVNENYVESARRIYGHDIKINLAAIG